MAETTQDLIKMLQDFESFFGSRPLHLIAKDSTGPYVEQEIHFEGPFLNGNGGCTIYLDPKEKGE